MGLVNENIPNPTAENQEGPIRINKYRESIVRSAWAGQFGAAMEGRYYTTSNPTPGTGIAHVTSSAISETAGYCFLMRNGDSVNGSNRRIIMDYIRLICTSVPTTGSRGDFYMKVGPATNRWTSGGTLLVPRNTNSAFANDSVAEPRFGALVTVADPASRFLCKGMLRGVIPVALDEWVLKFGGVEMGGATTLGGTVPLRMPIPVPPVVIAPGHTLGLQVWYASNNAAAEYEIEAGWWER
jgi:hypothetical protein